MAKHAKKSKKMKPMTKAQFANELADKINDTEMPKFKFDDDDAPIFAAKHVKAILGATRELVVDRLKECGKIPVGDLVNLKLADRQGRWMKNMFQGGKLMWVNPKTVVKAQLPKWMRDEFNESRKVKPGPKPKEESEEASEEASEEKSSKKKHKKHHHK